MRSVNNYFGLLIFKIAGFKQLTVKGGTSLDLLDSLIVLHFSNKCVRK